MDAQGHRRRRSHEAERAGAVLAPSSYEISQMFNACRTVGVEATDAATASERLRASRLRMP